MVTSVEAGESLSVSHRWIAHFASARWMVRTSSSNYSYFISKTYFLFIINNYFCTFSNSFYWALPLPVADYQNLIT